MRSTLLIFAWSILTLSLVSCDQESQESQGATVNGEVVIDDAHSYANIHQIRTKHLHIDIDVDFEKQTIYGVARHEMERLKDTDTAIFDINGPEIQKVTLGEKGKEIETDFIIGPMREFLGQPLSIKIKKDTKHINIYYKTTENAAALDWLEPELTEGKKHPYLYTQGQAILTRTWIPVQCTPANRITYSADVRVPSELMAVMSAKNSTTKSPTGEYHFEMQQPIPAYLIAMAVGNLEYKKLGDNCGVFTEPELMKKVAWEFEDLPKMIATAESLYGKYQWEQYDVLLLPYSFPFGGMENPRLTFANPTLIAGDRSAVSVIAHELAHSWSGNLVTNASWDDFWLNEGFTVYFENRIMEALYGKETADMLALIEFQELQNEIKLFNEDGMEEDTKLKLGLKDRNPDDGMTSIAYVKGAFFLKTLERDFGRERFDSFLKNYFKDHAFKTLTTEQFKKYLETNLIKPSKIKFNVDEWLYQPGLPKNCYAIESPRFEAIQKLAVNFVNDKNVFAKPKRKNKNQAYIKDRAQYIPQEWQAFIRKLPAKMKPEKLAELDAKLDFKGWGNAEVATEWFVLGIHSDYDAIKPNMEAFLMKVGRRKFLLPIYTALAETPRNKKWALSVYAKARHNYHPVSVMTIDKLLGYKAASSKTK